MRKNSIVAIALVLSVVMIGFMLTGCGKGGDTVSMYDLQQALLDSDDSLPEMKTVIGSGDESGELFAYVSDMDYDKVSDYCLAYAEEGAKSPAEIVVIALKNKSDVKTARDSLNKHVEERTKMYSQYQPKLVKSMEKAQIFTTEQYAVLIVADDAEAIKGTFQEFIK